MFDDRLHRIRIEVSHTSSGEPFDPKSDKATVWEKRPIEEKKSDVEYIRRHVKELRREADGYENLASILEKMYEASLSKMKLEESKQ